MKIYAFGERLEEKTEINDSEGLLVIAKEKEAQEAIERLGIEFKGIIELDKVFFNKQEVHHEYILGNLCIPAWDNGGQRMRNLIFYINERSILMVDDSGYVKKIVSAIQDSRINQGTTKERFLYDFFSQIMAKDYEQLEKRGVSIAKLEEEVLANKSEDLQNNILKVRKALMIFKDYYQEISDLMADFAENDNDFFDEDNLNYFDIIYGRAQRLKGRTEMYLEYLLQVREAHKELINERQNRNMNYLTVISTIFLPLTLITGWFGMNFENMPGLKNGFYWTVGGCFLVVIIVILIFKKKKIL